ncbi:hypothetical protein EIP91_003995 [Steccherinum ochraceum]|uniref:DNA damage-binding protein 1 n=1 Tax=Steccherinum ochraceum TaxID=92696 RepID=A0A4R0RL52_9APHY|nr:hypothetical protein EIP91_003995 [Steccherinum ochraceum]
MKLVTTFHPPSSVADSVKCVLSPDSEFGHLVVAKTNRIEVFSLTRDGLRQECDVEIWGRVLAVRAIPVKRESVDCHNILVMVDHPDPRIVVLSYEEENGSARLTDVGSVFLHDRVARHAEFCNDVVVDPTGNVAVVSCYVGKLRVLVLNEGVIEQDFDVILPELNLLSLSFLHTSNEQYSLAIVHLDFQQRIQLLCRDLNVEAQDLAAETSQVLPNTVLSAAIFPFADVPPVLIPVPPFALSGDCGSENKQSPGGVLVVGGRKILFYELASLDDQSVRKGKKRRLDKRKASLTESEVEKAKEKEKDRETRKLKPKCFVKWPWSEVTSWTSVDTASRKFFLGDKFGRLSMLVLDDSPKLILIPVGEISPPTSITYLSNQVLYVGSHLGPAQLVRMHQEIIDSPEDDTLPIPSGFSTATSLSSPAAEDESGDGHIDNRRANGIIIRSKGNHLEILDTYRNIAPIMDAVLADPESSGQIVTCSGGANSGSLNVIRSGAEVNELAIVEGLSCVSSVFPIRTRYESSTHSHLLISTSYESHVFRLDGQDAFTRLDAATCPFVTYSPTLALSNIPRRVTTNVGGKSTSSYVDSSLVVQVTSKGIRILEFDEALGTFHVAGDGWSVDNLDPTWQGREVVAASVNASQFVLAFSGGRLALFNMADDRTVRMQHRFVDKGNNAREICAVSCAPFDRTKSFSLFVAVSYWDSNKVEILSLKSQNMESVASTIELPALPRSIMLHNFGTGNKAKESDYQPHVLAGLTDGSVVSFVFRNNELLDRKIFGLGTAPVTLSTCEVQGRHAVFASGSRAAILHWDRKRLRQSAVMLKEIVVGVTLNTSLFPSALVAATSDSLIICRISGIDKLQVRSMSLGLDNPTRIAHDPISNMFGVTSLRSTPSRIGDAETTLSSFNAFDGSLRRLGQYTCEADEEVTAVATAASLPLSRDGRQSSCFVVGSVQHQLGKLESELGRLMVFPANYPGAASGGAIRPLISTETEGCVYAIAILEKFIAVAVNTAVHLYRITSTEESDGLKLERVSQWNHNYFVTSLVARDGHIVAGDAISSVTVLRIQDSELKSVARDYSPLWPVAVEMTSKQGVVGADSDCNLFTFSLGRSGTRTVLERDGFYHVGEVVNKFLPGGIGALDSNEVGSFQPEHLFFTSTGRIGQTLQAAEDVALPLTALQRNMAKYIKGVGDMSHTKFRAPANARGRTDAEPAFGFLDGDFMELFLADSRKHQFLNGDLEVERTGLSQPEAEALLEKLQSLH